MEWTVGPIPVEDGLGKEVVLRLTSDLQSGSEWFTDSNGREMLRRRRNFRPTWNLTVIEPISGNYYPLTAAMYLEVCQGFLEDLISLLKMRTDY